MTTKTHTAKTDTSKLTLRRATLRQLSTADLRQVAGGPLGPPTPTAGWR